MEVIQDALRFLHSWVRWLLLAAMLVTVAYFVLRLARRGDYDILSSRLMTVFSSLVGLQWVLGLALMIAWGSIVGFAQRHFWEHLIVMTVALVVAHGHFMMRRRSMPPSTRYGRYLALIAVTVVLIIIGIATLPDGMQWRFYAAA